MNILKTAAFVSTVFLAGCTMGPNYQRPLVKIGDRIIANRFDVERALWSYKAGDKIEAVVLREAKETHVSMTLTGSNGIATAAMEETILRLQRLTQ